MVTSGGASSAVFADLLAQDDTPTFPNSNTNDAESARSRAATWEYRGDSGMMRSVDSAREDPAAEVGRAPGQKGL
jgi:hypothetical protein